MIDIIQWAATAATILAAFVTAGNFGTRITGYGFAIFLVGSLAWIATALMTGQTALLSTNAVLTLLNIFGIWRWLGRQAKVEEGADTAAHRSRAGPGKDLFPVSLLTKAEIAYAGAKAGQCVDAMAARSGGIEYLVFSEGGVAGVGETFRRVEWADVAVECDALTIAADPQSLPTVKRDKWPGR